MITIPDTDTPVVVLKLYHYLALGVVRSLGRMGIPVYGIEHHRRSPGINSRYCRENFFWDIDGSSPEATTEFLLRVGRKIGRRSLLIHTADESAQLVADYAGVLKERYIFPLKTPELVRALVSKKEMFFLAKKHGIPTAETLFPNCRDDVFRFLDTVTFPVMLKGIDGRLLEERTGRKMAIVRTREELIAMYDQMEDAEHPNLMLQEYIPGGDDTVWMFNGYFNGDSDCLFGITGKKIRQAPVYMGYTSLGICLHNETVDTMTRDFMKRLGYRGILDIGYRYDARDGRYKVLDINPRIGATFRLFVGDDGMDVARAEYLDLTGQKVPASNMRQGRKWVVFDRDVISSVRYYRDGKLSIGEWIRSFRGVEETAYYASDDPIPFFLMIWGLVLKIFRMNGSR